MMETDDSLPKDANTGDIDPHASTSSPSSPPTDNKTNPDLSQQQQQQQQPHPTSNTTAPSPPRWRFVNEAKKTYGYSTSDAGRQVKGLSAEELAAKYVPPSTSDDTRQGDAVDRHVGKVSIPSFLQGGSQSQLQEHQQRLRALQQLQQEAEQIKQEQERLREEVRLAQQHKQQLEEEARQAREEKERMEVEATLAKEKLAVIQDKARLAELEAQHQKIQDLEKKQTELVAKQAVAREKEERVQRDLDAADKRAEEQRLREEEEESSLVSLMKAVERGEALGESSPKEDVKSYFADDGSRYATKDRAGASDGNASSVEPQRCYRRKYVMWGVYVSVIILACIAVVLGIVLSILLVFRTNNSYE